MANRAPTISLEELRAGEKKAEGEARALQLHRATQRIADFNEEFDFLNMEHQSTVVFEGESYPSIFAAFQAAKTRDEGVRKALQKARNVFEVIEAVRNASEVPDWPGQRERMMTRLVRDKFVRDAELRRRLLETGERELVNSYADETPANLFWGVVWVGGTRGWETAWPKGDNRFGEILMRVRAEIGGGRASRNWLSESLCLPVDRPERILPSLSVRYSNDEDVDLPPRPFWTLGNEADTDFRLADEGVAPLHAALAFHPRLGLVLVDCASEAGTFLQKQRIPPFQLTRVPPKASFSLGASPLITPRPRLGRAIRAIDQRLRVTEAKIRLVETFGAEKLEEMLKDSPKSAVFCRLPPMSRRQLYRELDRLGPVDNLLHLESKGVAIVRFERQKDAERAVRDGAVYFLGQRVIAKEMGSEGEDEAILRLARTLDNKERHRAKRKRSDEDSYDEYRR